MDTPDCNVTWLVDDSRSGRSHVVIIAVHAISARIRDVRALRGTTASGSLPKPSCRKGEVTSASASALQAKHRRPTVGEQLHDYRPTKNAALTAICNTAPQFPY
ncbi:hypothetical protein EYF80_002713 [Liparis tanakae]|uniref:Uncharacterized protein n=1 Tax=Liparis tanakae TaxID=230148 RepID=A0A4Z2JBD7_9TELE|nr:hypothetical protein EYF80_002713 [Liparis tanakae]